MPPGSLDITSLLRHSQVFGELDDGTLAALAASLSSMTVRGGGLLFSAGEPSDALYILQSGSLGVFRKPRAGGAPHLAGLLGAGDTVGTAGLLLDQPHYVSVRALRDSQLLRLSRETFRALVREHPQIIIDAAPGALRSLLLPDGDEPRILPRTFALLPHAPDIPVRDLAEQLRHALLPFGNCMLIDEALGHDRDPSWFAEREREMRFVLYVDEGREERWRNLCRRQADALLLAVRSERTPAAWPDHAALLEHADLQRPRHLLLLHPDGDIVPGSARAWCDAIGGIDQHHHVRGLHDTHRLARLLARRSLGIVLSGGGARGFAAIGMVRALHEHGYDIDRVGGTSIGAIIGAGIATEWDDAALTQYYREGFVDGRLLSDWTLPLVALSRGERASRLLQYFFKDLDIADLPIPFFCVSSDLTRGGADVHRGGPLWLWLRASSAVPGLFPPLLRTGRVHVDGAVTNNLPVDVMYDHGMGAIVACDIRSEDVLHTDLDRAWMPGWWQQWRLRRRMPGIGAILLRAGMVNAESEADSRRELATRVIAPDMQGIGLLDFKAFDRVIEAGYRATVQALEEPLL